MKRYWEQLKPGERRWVASIGLVFFILANWWFVYPHFSDWGKAEARMKKAHDLMRLYENEIKNERTYQNKIAQLQAGGGSEVVQEDQAIDIIRFYSSRANSNNVQVINNSRPITRTNDPFFVDHEMQLNIQGRESQIVNFLYSLGAGNSIVRVRGLSLRPDSTHQQINANISIVASYAKKPPVRAGAASATPRSTAAQPARPAKPVVTSRSTVSNNQPVPLTAKRP